MPENLRIAARWGQPVLPLLERAHAITCGGPMPKLVFLVMVHLGHRTGACWASVETIARHAEAGTATVRRSLRTLAAGGRIVAEGGLSRGRRATWFRLPDSGPAPARVDVEPNQSERVEPNQSERVEPNQSERVTRASTHARQTPYGVTGARGPAPAVQREAVRRAAAEAEAGKARGAGTPARRSKVAASRPVSNGHAGRGLHVRGADATARWLADNRAERRRLSELRRKEGTHE